MIVGVTFFPPSSLPKHRLPLFFPFLRPDFQLDVHRLVLYSPSYCYNLIPRELMNLPKSAVWSVFISRRFRCLRPPVISLPSFTSAPAIAVILKGSPQLNLVSTVRTTAKVCEPGHTTDDRERHPGTSYTKNVLADLFNWFWALITSVPQASGRETVKLNQ